MNDNTFALIAGIILVLISIIGTYLFFKLMRKDRYDSSVLRVSNLKVILSLVAIGLFDVFLIFNGLA